MRLLFIYDEPGKLTYVDFAPENEKENVSPSEADELIKDWNEDAGYEAFRIVETDSEDMKEMAGLLVPAFTQFKTLADDLDNIAVALRKILGGLTATNNSLEELLNAVKRSKSLKKAAGDLHKILKGGCNVSDGLFVALKGLNEALSATKTCLDRIKDNPETEEAGKEITALTITVNMTGKKPN